MMHPA
jgi:hypothetical protein